MNKIVHYIGLDVHKESIAVSIAPQNSTARFWTAVASRTRHRFGEGVQVFGDDARLCPSTAAVRGCAPAAAGPNF